MSYVYKAGLTDPPASMIPVAWDKPDIHENYGNVLFLDGNVRSFGGSNWMEQAGIKKSLASPLNSSQEYSGEERKQAADREKRKQ